MTGYPGVGIWCHSKDSRQVKVPSQAMSWETQALERRSSHGIQTDCPPSLQGLVQSHSGQTSWKRLYPALQTLLAQATRGAHVPAED